MCCMELRSANHMGVVAVCIDGVEFDGWLQASGRDLCGGAVDGNRGFDLGVWGSCMEPGLVPVCRGVAW